MPFLFRAVALQGSPTAFLPTRTRLMRSTQASSSALSIFNIRLTHFLPLTTLFFPHDGGELTAATRDDAPSYIPLSLASFPSIPIAAFTSSGSVSHVPPYMRGNDAGGASCSTASFVFSASTMTMRLRMPSDSHGETIAQREEKRLFNGRRAQTQECQREKRVEENQRESVQRVCVRSHPGVLMQIAAPIHSG